MKPVKAWEALRAWQEEGRKCRPIINNTTTAFKAPSDWDAIRFVVGQEFELGPPVPQVVEFEGKVECTNVNVFSIIYFECPEDAGKKLVGKRWRVTCTEIVDD